MNRHGFINLYTFIYPIAVIFHAPLVSRKCESYVFLKMNLDHCLKLCLVECNFLCNMNNYIMEYVFVKETTNKLIPVITCVFIGPLYCHGSSGVDVHTI